MTDVRRRVKYYSATDVYYGIHLQNAEKMLKEYVVGGSHEINDVIELFNIGKFFADKIFLIKWTEDEICSYKNVIMEETARQFKSINDSNFLLIYQSLDKIYFSDFWELFDKFKIYNVISKTTFKSFLLASKPKLYEILQHKQISKSFGEALRNYMMDNINLAELLLNEYEVRHISQRPPLFFPKELSNVDKEAIICNYIESDNPNINYLRLIGNIQSNKNKIEVSPRVCLKAKKKSDMEEKKYSSSNSSIPVEIYVAFSESQDEELIFDQNGLSTRASYSKKWIIDNLDYPTLLNNFIYLFNYTDLQMRWLMVNKFNEMSVLERFVFISSKNAYIKGIAFDTMNILSLFQIEGYYNTLFSIGIRLEEIIEWFFQEYIPSEFNVNGFQVFLPSHYSTLLEKCTSIMPAMESVLKQFSLYVEEGEINFELLNIKSEHIMYNNIPSLIKEKFGKKYAYGTGDEYCNVTFLLFSDQSGLGYNDKAGDSYTNFFELLSKTKLKKNDFESYQHSKLDWLFEHGYLLLDNEDDVIFRSKEAIHILKDLYFNEVISYWKYPKTVRKIMDQMNENKIIEFESSLFSRPEQAYVNYFLNKSQFNNGLDLRNKYIHIQPPDENHNENYMFFLRLFILTVIKINDDFCILTDIQKLKQ